MPKSTPMVKPDIEAYIRQLEADGDLDPACRGCQQDFYPALRKGREHWEVFAPRHKASSRCRSGKHAHCTCDTCF